FAQRMKIQSPSKVMFDAGVNIDTGLALGIESARPLVVREVHELAAAPISAIADRSEIDAATRVSTASAVAVRDERDAAPRIPARVEIAARPAAPRAPTAAAARRSGPLVAIENLVVQTTAGDDATAQALSIRRELERVLEGLAIELGALRTE